MKSAGKPIESGNLERRVAEAEQTQQSAFASAVAAEKKIIHLRRALQASPRQPPAGQIPGNEGRLHISARPGPGAGRIGRHVTAQATGRKSAFLTEPKGTGLIQILRPGEPWSFVSGQQTDSVEARLDPPRTIRYDELLVPVISGRITATLYGPDGAETFGPFERTRLLRFEEPKLTNGRVQIQSSASTQNEDGYVHVGGGLELKESDWAGSWSVRGDFVAPTGGPIEVLGAQLFPSGKEISSLTFYEDGNETGATFSLSQGDSFVVEGTRLHPTQTCTHLTVRYAVV